MSMLRRAIGRAQQELVAPLRKSTARDQKRLGSYPVSAEFYVHWKNRFQVPGVQVMQSVSPFQQKWYWQYWHVNPGKWWYRMSNWAWPVGVPFATFCIWMKSVEHDQEVWIRNHTWY